jgi:hypothetical protein
VRNARSPEASPLDVRIAELVVEGLPLTHPERLAGAVEEALTARLAAAPPRPAAVVPVDAGWESTRELAGTGVDELADAVAASVEDAIRARFGARA